MLEVQESSFQNVLNVVPVNVIPVHSIKEKSIFVRAGDLSCVAKFTSQIKVTGYSCARCPKCIGKCILKLANQKSRVRRAWATWFWRWRCAVTRCRAWRKLLRIRCIAVQKRAVQFTKKPYLPLFSSETADKFAKDYAIEKSFRHALHLVTAHLHRQNQVADTLRTRDFWLASLSIHFPIHFTCRAHEYPVTLRLWDKKNL